MLRRAGVSAVAIALTCGFALSACSADKPAAKASPSPSATPTVTSSGSPSPSGSPSTSPSATESLPVVPEPTLPAATKGKAGQEAFARYVVDAWHYALETNDASLLVDVSAGNDPCKGCSELEAELTRRTSEGWSVAPFDLTVDKVRVATSGGSTTASVQFDIPETTSMFDDGTVRNTSAAHPDSTFTIVFALNKKEYRLVGFTIR